MSCTSHKKSLEKIIVVSAIACSALASSSYGQSDPIASESRLTLALTLEYTAPGLRPRDEDGAFIPFEKLVGENEWYRESNRPAEGITETFVFTEKKKFVKTERFGNKEFLLSLVERGTIEGIANWYISVFHDSDADPYAVYLSNLVTGERISVGGELGLIRLEDRGSVGSFSGTSRTRDYDSPTSVIHTFNSSGTGVRTIDYDFGVSLFGQSPSELDFHGNVRFRLPIRERRLEEAPWFAVPLVGASTGLVAGFTFPDELEEYHNGEPALVGGRISTTAGIVLDELPEGVIEP